MTNTSDTLAALRDVHLPPAVAWWPPAPGWWAVAALILLLAFLLWRGLRHFQTAAPYRDALRQLKQLEREHQGPDAEFAAALSRLLRRYALWRFPREQAAGLVGEPWLNFLDHTGKLQQRFSNGPGRQLITAPYQAQGHVDRPALLALAEQWLRRVGKRHP